MPVDLARLSSLTGAEVRWRAIAVSRAAADRLRSAVAPPRWDRRALAGELVGGDGIAEARIALERNRTAEAEEALAVHFAAAPQRFLIAPSRRDVVVRAIGAECPAARAEAVDRADRILSGEYDLLGYRGLRIDGPDWHLDPVHGRRAPARFWTTVPFLDPSCGDHKIIWELNRHQHWLALGRAYWLTGDSRYRTACLGQLASWMSANPPLVGINWASMLELAFRSISWIWALQFFAVDSDETPWIADLLLGLVRQLRHVERNLSYYFSPNTHLLGEALALYVAGRALPELRSSRRWTATGRAILIAEIDRQIADDGGHAERSAHYHRYTLDFYLMALAVARVTRDADAVGPFEEVALRLAFACRLLADDRGRLPQLGDDDGGALAPLCDRAPDAARSSLWIAAALLERPELRIGRTPEEAFWFLADPALMPLVARAAAAPPPTAPLSGALPDTGYYVSRSPSGDHLVVDAGPHGFQNGGHAHADALSLTLTVRGNPLLIDPGTGCYTIDPAMRDRFRSSQLHNTLTLDGRSQSLPRGPFHWAHTATSEPQRWRTNSAFDYVEARHDGYAPIEHRRHVLAMHGDLLIVADLVGAPAGDPGEHEAAVHWHLDPRWAVDVQGARARLATAGDLVELGTPDGAFERFSGDVESGLGWHAPAYGRIAPATTLRVARRGPLPLWIVSVLSLNADLPIDRIDYLPVWAEAGVLAASTAIRIARGASVDFFVVAHRASAEAAGVRADSRAATPTDMKRAVTWRVGELETDAGMLCCRMRADGRVERAALVDGSLFRFGGRRVGIALPRAVPDLGVHFDAAPNGAALPKARVSGRGVGARIVVAGRELPIAVERRAVPRATRRPVNE